MRRTVWSTLRSTLKQIVGMPDYARYLEQVRAESPDRPPLSEREFYDQFIAQRYDRAPIRCC